MAIQKEAGTPIHRVHVFVDFWNFTLSMRRAEEGFRADFRALGPALVKAAVELVDPAAYGEYAGLSVYISSDANSQAEAKLRRWATDTLDLFPGVKVSLVDRVKEVEGPRCPKCHKVVERCPECTADMRGTEEKGVDVRIATDMIMLAWVDSYDVAVLVSSDSDFIPVADFLQTKGKKVIHARFPPRGAQLSQKCWASINVPKMRETFRLQSKKPTGTKTARRGATTSTKANR